MANITAELQAIMAAVFGRDVRQSIHDAIFKINVASEMQMNAGTDITSSSSSSEGFCEGSLYINTSTYELWRCVGENSWQSLGILKGTDGRAIASITQTSTTGNVDTYTISYSDGTSSTFTVTNGTDGKDGSIWYKGTALTGNGTGITGFPGKEHDFYINSSTGYVYNCYQTGGASNPGAALWEFVMIMAGGGGSSIAVIDHLNSDSTTDALSAHQGKVLNTKKLDKPSSPDIGDMIQWNGTDWVAVPEPEGHPMVPDPESQAPASAAAQEAAIVQAINAGRTEGWSNDDVASHNSIAHWSNAMFKTFTISGIAGDSTPIGTTGIGTWYYGDMEDFDPTTDEVDWISIPALIGIGDADGVDFNIVYDPKTVKIPIIKGGYIIDDTTGKVCIKFANEIDEDDTHTAVIGLEVIYKRTDIIPVSI